MPCRLDHLNEFHGRFAKYRPPKVCVIRPRIGIAAADTSVWHEPKHAVLIDGMC